VQFAHEHERYRRAFGPAARTPAGASKRAKFASKRAASAVA
jgi:hypothetical protein